MRLPKMALVLAIPAFALAIGWSLQPGDAGPNAAETPTNAADGAGPLDGLVFKGGVSPAGDAKDIADVFVFEDGTFVSMECELRCDYPARPYFVRSADGKTEFISETRCPYKDATIVWRGVVDGDRIEGHATWRVKRWYWTIEKRLEFSGTLTDRTPLAARD